MVIISVVFVGDFSYPHGMAGTKRVQHAINGIKDKSNMSVRVIVYRQLSWDNVLSGEHHDVPYEAVMGDVFRARLICLFPVFCLRAIRLLKRAFRSDSKNIIYHYGPPNLFNFGVLAYAKWLGYKIIFDIVEDSKITSDIPRSYYRKITFLGTHHIEKKIKPLSSGIVVISTHLYDKYKRLVGEKIPLHYRPISVDFNCYPSFPKQVGNSLTLFYSGSFDKKDGVIHLIEAFDMLAGKHPHIRLVLTGRGRDEDLDKVFGRINISPFKDKIDYKGYLDDKAYYSTLNSIDIPCMTRIDIPFAHAGFPFKLGEYLATAKPVIASRVSDVESFLKGHYNAVLINPGDSSEIVTAVEYLITHPDQAISIGRRGREAAQVYFDYKEQGRKLISFMEQV